MPSSKETRPTLTLLQPDGMATVTSLADYRTRKQVNPDEIDPQVYPAPMIVRTIPSPGLVERIGYGAVGHVIRLLETAQNTPHHVSTALDVASKIINNARGVR